MDDCAVSNYNLLPEVLRDFKLSDNIKIYDSTLRDGEQMPGVCFSIDQKLSIAKKLDEIGVPEIEVGFPAISKNEQNIVKKIANENLNSKILVLSRLKKEDIDAAIKSDADVILLFIASSPLHLKYKLHVSKEEIKDMIAGSIQYVKDHGVIPSFSTEDSTRTPIDTLEDFIKIAYESGAIRIGFTDTVGCATPQTIKYLFNYMRKIVPLPFSAHLHNDFGLGVINAITALSSGANHICTTVNGIGERAGNVSLEQLVMVLKVLYNKDIGIKTEGFKDLSEMVSKYTGNPIPKNQPFVGDNIFTHESGIHVAAILENPQTYEPISPELVGNKRNFVLGKHSGRKIVRKILQENNINFDEQIVMEITSKIKEIGEKNGFITRKEINLFIADKMGTIYE